MKSFYERSAVALASLALLAGTMALGSSLAAAAVAPSVTSASPTSGTTAGGTVVTITGFALASTSAVHFGANAATIGTISSTSVTATSPAGSAGTVDVTVTTPIGTSATSSADHFTYVAPTSIAPTTQAATGVSATNATLNGVNGSIAATGHSFWASTSTFSTASPTPPAGVYSTPDLGAVAANGAFSALLTSVTGLSAVTPNTTYYFAGWTNVGGTWYPGAVLHFTTEGAATSTTPVVSAVSPTSGTTAGGTTVTITGTGLASTTAVHFGAVAATLGTISSTSVTATSPAGSAGTVDVTVTTPNGTSATSAADHFTYVAPASTAPIISGIGVTTNGTTSAIISWLTDSAADSRVVYGTSASYGSSVYNATATTTHSVLLNNLTEATLYHFAVVSANAGGTSTSTDQVFTAGSTASSTPLSLSGVTPVSTTATADGTFLHGFSWILHFVVPTNETSFQMKFSDFTTPTSAGTIPAASNIRYYSAQASNASSSASAVVETNNEYGGALLLSGDTSDSTPGRQIDVTVEVSVPSGTPTGVYSTNFGALSTTTTP